MSSSLKIKLVLSAIVALLMILHINHRKSNPSDPIEYEYVKAIDLHNSRVDKGLSYYPKVWENYDQACEVRDEFLAACDELESNSHNPIIRNDISTLRKIVERRKLAEFMIYAVDYIHEFHKIEESHNFSISNE